MRVFCSIAAQSDNLGDVAIRRSMIHWIAGTGAAPVVYVGQMPSSYIDACNLPPGSRQVVNSVIFEALLLMSCISRRTVIAFAPGPQVFGTSSRAILKALVNLFNVGLVRMSGGRALAVGRSLRGTGKATRLIERRTIKLFNVYKVRDNVSGHVVGLELESCPDLAFDTSFEIPPEKHARTLFAISLRSDGGRDEKTLVSAVDFARSLGLIPVFVTQVQRDNRMHQELAVKHGTDLIAWTDQSHIEQLIRVDAAYRNSAFVLTDRLHAAILGSIQGALPIDVAGIGASKLKDTLESVIPLGVWLGEEQKALADQHLHQRQFLGELQDAISRTRDSLCTAKAEFKAGIG